jgi:mxaA protein
MSLVKLFCCLFLCFYSAWVNSETHEASADMVIKMRDSGYTMGDYIDMQVKFSLPNNEKLNEESLPLIGRFKPWLDLHAIHVKQDNETVYMHITWQIFATVEIAQTLSTPEFSLKTIGKSPINIVIPAQPFYFSPVFPAPPLKEIKRRENYLPPNFDVDTPLIGLSLSLVVLFVLLIIWLWLQDVVPWLPYRAGPITQVYRKLNGMHLQNDSIHKPLSSASLSNEQLREIHHALNTVAGLSLYPQTLSQLFINAPYLEAEKSSITKFFNRSWNIFYPNKLSSLITIDLIETKQWLQKASVAERLFRRTKTRK